jgi:hypothetical protein
VSFVRLPILSGNAFRKESLWKRIPLEFYWITPLIPCPIKQFVQHRFLYPDDDDTSNSKLLWSDLFSPSVYTKLLPANARKHQNAVADVGRISKFYFPTPHGLLNTNRRNHGLRELCTVRYAIVHDLLKCYVCDTVSSSAVFETIDRTHELSNAIIDVPD